MITGTIVLDLHRQSRASLPIFDRGMFRVSVTMQNDVPYRWLLKKDCLTMWYWTNESAGIISQSKGDHESLEYMECVKMKQIEDENSKPYGNKGSFSKRVFHD